MTAEKKIILQIYSSMYQLIFKRAYLHFSVTVFSDSVRLSWKDVHLWYKVTISDRFLVITSCVSGKIHKIMKSIYRNCCIDAENIYSGSLMHQNYQKRGYKCAYGAEVKTRNFKKLDFFLDCTYTASSHLRFIGHIYVSIFVISVSRSLSLVSVKKWNVYQTFFSWMG